MRTARNTTFTATLGGRKVFKMRATRLRALTAILWLSALILSAIVFELVLS